MSGATAWGRRERPRAVAAVARTAGLIDLSVATAATGSTASKPRVPRAMAAPLGSRRGSVSLFDLADETRNGWLADAHERILGEMGNTFVW